jgi:hypothetical protein
MVMRLLPSATLLMVLAIACEPTLDNTDSIVSTSRVVAVRADPAEAAPMAAVTYTALVVDSTGTLTVAPLDWAFCNEPKPLSELEPVSPDCLSMSGPLLQEIGDGTSVMATIPTSACQTFGPEVAPPMMGQPAARPVDPDSTGGYYQALRLALVGTSPLAYTLAQSRLSCGIAGASSSQIAQFSMQYLPNTNPAIDSLAVDGAPPMTVAVGAHVTLHAAWADCTGATASCTGSEPYVVFDLASRSISPTREALQVAWFATAGSFDIDHTGRSSTDPTTFSENGWTAPSQPGSVALWVVLRDDRGGAGWQQYTVTVQ